MSVFRDPLGILSLLLLIVPVMIAVNHFYVSRNPKGQPKQKQYFLIGAIVGFCLFLTMMPMMMPVMNLGVVWCAFVIWLVVCFVASKIQKRVLQFKPEVRKLVVALLFTVFLVFPLFYAFILPEMEREAAVQEAKRREEGRVLLIAHAEHGSATAQFDLGHLYATGDEGMKQDFAEAAKWYLMAAEQGDAEAQAALGRLYVDGTGVKQLDPEAYFWLSLAAERPNEGNKGWIITLRDRTELYMEKKDIKAVKQRVKDWKPKTKK